MTGKAVDWRRHRTRLPPVSEGFAGSTCVAPLQGCSNEEKGPGLVRADARCLDWSACSCEAMGGLCRRDLLMSRRESHRENETLWRGAMAETARPGSEDQGTFADPFACALQLRHALGARGHPRESHEAGAGARRKQAHEGAKGSDDRAISTTGSTAQRSVPHDGDPRSRKLQILP